MSDKIVWSDSIEVFGASDLDDSIIESLDDIMGDCRNSISQLLDELGEEVDVE